MVIGSGSLLLALVLLPRPVLSGVEQTLDAGAWLKVHYTLTGLDALAHGPTDVEPQNGLPDDAEAAGAGAAQVLRYWTTTGGMLAPLPDGGAGGDRRVDLYLRRLDGPRGYAHVEEVGVAPAASAWLEVDPRTALQSLRRLSAAAGHEAHHAIQFAYSAALDRWAQEATATWVEDHDFGLADEQRAHIQALLAQPSIPITTVDGAHEYHAMGFMDFVLHGMAHPDPGRDLGPRFSDPDRWLDEVWRAMRDRGGAMAGIQQVLGRTGAEAMYDWASYLLLRPEGKVSLAFFPAGPRRDLSLPPFSLLMLSVERLDACLRPLLLVDSDGSVAFGLPPSPSLLPPAGRHPVPWAVADRGLVSVLARGEAGPAPTVGLSLLVGEAGCEDMAAAVAIPGADASVGAPSMPGGLRLRDRPGRAGGRAVSVRVDVGGAAAGRAHDAPGATRISATGPARATMKAP